MHIRQATVDDARAIATVQVEGWQSTYRGLVADEFLDRMSVDERDAQWLDASQRPDVLLNVAEDQQGEVVAFAASGPERSSRNDYRAELYSIYILTRCRGRGLGKTLVRAAACGLLAGGHDRMLVWTFADNVNRRFYEVLGGKLIDQQPIEIGAQTLIEVAYGWDDLRRLAVEPAG